MHKIWINNCERLTNWMQCLKSRTMPLVSGEFNGCHSAIWVSLNLAERPHWNKRKQQLMVKIIHTNNDWACNMLTESYESNKVNILCVHGTSASFDQGQNIWKRRGLLLFKSIPVDVNLWDYLRVETLTTK